MKSFTEFITEKFFTGWEGHGYMGYTEAWIDPTTDEIRAAAGNRPMQVNSYATAPDKVAYYCRGWITDKHLFVWSADSDDHMSVENAIKEYAQENKLSISFTNALAVELYYFAKVNTLGIHVAQWSNPRRLTDTQAAKSAAQHPAIQKLRFSKIIPMNVKAG